MKKQFKISIPKPCHEDWSKMTPKEKGRFCQSCTKTVIDFTKKSKEEIQQYLSDNFGKNICGRFRRHHLDAITLEIPEVTFHQSLSYQKLFLLALLFVMGTTLFSCQNSNGAKQKIEDVILIDSIPEVIQKITDCKVQKDSAKTDSLGSLTGIDHRKLPPIVGTTGIVVVESDLKTKKEVKAEKKEKQSYYILGGARFLNTEAVTRKTYMNSNLNYSEAIPIDSIIEIEEEEEIIEYLPSFGVNTDSKHEDKTIILCSFPSEKEEKEEEELDFVMGHIIEAHPRFPESDSLTGEKAREDFNNRMKLFFKKHFKTPQGSLGLTSKRYRLIAGFQIDTTGHIKDLQIRSPHPTLTKEVERVIKMLPTFIPGEQRGTAVNTRYTLPIFINWEE